MIINYNTYIYTYTNIRNMTKKIYAPYIKVINVSFALLMHIIYYIYIP